MCDKAFRECVREREREREGERGRESNTIYSVNYLSHEGTLGIHSITSISSLYNPCIWLSQLPE